ncbi:protein timeless homolog [Rhinatrema bivittatum]|uniref:protein timeless homolog n=1 Tax=Rhinatrema bivittatum TaxID=194408 RepID=UPI001128ED49|nr:protein timeless homolog [Rhinatrema bivittatum]XP_029450671.1 protein timeless homolog [Rhinatrema bivittatum]
MDLYMMNCELLATCSALGYLEGDTYHKEPDCLESVKDLIRYLRHEDDTRDIRQQLGAAQILQNDLVPMVIQYHQDKQLFDVLIRLIVNLTQPALLCFGKVPQDPTFRHHYLQVVSYLQAYKEAFANEKLFGSLSEKMYELLQLDWEHREDEDNLLIERLLLLIRNILHVPADPEEEKSMDDDASTHDKVLWAIHMSGMDDLLKFLASSQMEQQWSMHVLEIISLMFRDQKPEQLAGTGQARSANDWDSDVRDLEALRQREAAERKSRSFQRGTRHSRFGGSYIVQGLKAIGDRDVVFHKGLHNFKNYSHDLGKEVRRVPKRRQVAKETELRRRSAFNVRLFLREFCIDFLENCYNRLMSVVKDHLIREHAHQHDETYYLWALAFFMAFNRLHLFRPELVSETVSIRTFHFVEQNLTNYYEMMLTDKKEAVSWSRRMHLALKAYQELLTTLYDMDLCKEEAVRESSKIIKSNIFYLMEYRELFLTLFRKFDETKQPRSFLKDLVETVHLFLKMLEKFCKGRNNLVVQNKKVKKKKRPRAHPAMPELHPKTPQELELLWESLCEQLCDCAKGTTSLPEDMVVPFDAASEVPVEEQRADAMVQIQECLLTSRGSEALSLLRAAREVWPEGDAFGSSGLEPEEEVQLLKQILFADLHRQTVPRREEPEEMEEEEEIEEELHAVQVSEKEFNFFDYLKRFASFNIVKPYFLLLKSYQQNTNHTNHCIVKMLHRVAYDLKMEALLFQLSVFCLFNHLLCDPAASAYKELVTFAKYILNRFFALAATNKKAYVELLFWKTTTVVREMTEGYHQPGDSDDNRRRSKWSPAEQQQLKELYLEYREVEGEDVVDAILARLKPASWTRRQVINQLVAMELADSVKDFKREKKGTRIVLWTQEQEMELQRLYEEFQETDDILGNIMKNITAKRSRARIIEKLISMGLVSDRKELYKKRRRKGKSHGMTEEEFLRDLGVNDQDEEEEEDEEEDDDGKSEEEEEEEERWGKTIIGSRSKENVESLHLAGTGLTAFDRRTESLVLSLQQEGLSGPLLWLQNCLTRMADDREEDGISQAVPLVPLTEESEDAMENKQFQKLLKKVGARPPANEQESFWRIPAKLSPEQLRRVATSITLQNTEGEEEEKSTEAGRNSEEKDPSLEQKAEALRALLLARKKQQSSSEKPAEEEAETAGEQPWQKRPVESDSESESSQEREKCVLSKPASKRFRVIDSEEEEEASSKEMMEQDQGSDSEGSPRPSKRRYSQINEDED